MKIFSIGKLKFVWDWVENVKWLGFLSGVFFAVAITGYICLVKNLNFLASVILLGSGCLGFGISSFINNIVINENHKLE